MLIHAKLYSPYFFNYNKVKYKFDAVLAVWFYLIAKVLIQSNKSHNKFWTEATSKDVENKKGVRVTKCNVYGDKGRV